MRPFVLDAVGLLIRDRAFSQRVFQQSFKILLTSEQDLLKQLEQHEGPTPAPSQAGWPDAERIVRHPLRFDRTHPDQPTCLDLRVDLGSLRQRRQ